MRKICAENSSIMSHTEQPWPSEGIYCSSCPTIIGPVHLRDDCPIKLVGADFWSPTKQLELVLLKPDSTAFFIPRPIVHPNLIRLSKQCDEHCPMFWESSLHLMDSLQLPMQKVIEDIFFELEKSQLKQVLCGLLSLMKDKG